MKPGSVKIVDRVSAVEAIKRLNDEALLFLNLLIVERLKLISHDRATMLMISFTRGDWVGFQTPAAGCWNVFHQIHIGFYLLDCNIALFPYSLLNTLYPNIRS